MGNEEFGNYIRKLRKDAGYKSTAALAAAAGINYSTINRLELGKTLKPDTDTLVKIAPYLGVNIKDLLEAGGYIQPDESLSDNISDYKINTNTSFGERLPKLYLELPEEAQKSLKDFFEYLYQRNVVFRKE